MARSRAALVSAAVAAVVGLGACTGDDGAAAPGTTTITSAPTAPLRADGHPAPVVREAGLWTYTEGEAYVAVVVANPDSTSTAVNTVVTMRLIDPPHDGAGDGRNYIVPTIPPGGSTVLTVRAGGGKGVRFDVGEVESWTPGADPLALRVEGAKRQSTPIAAADGIRLPGQAVVAAELVSSRSAPAAVNVHCLFRDATGALRGGTLTTLLDVAPGSRVPFTVNVLGELPPDWTTELVPQLAPVRDGTVSR